jgi:hypothetical protein
MSTTLLEDSLKDVKSKDLGVNLPIPHYVIVVESDVPKVSIRQCIWMSELLLNLDIEVNANFITSSVLFLLWLGIQFAAGLHPPLRVPIFDLGSMKSIRTNFRHAALVDDKSRTHLAIVASSQSRQQLCKTIASALVNGYDAPHLIDFNKTLALFQNDTIGRYNNYLQGSESEDNEPVLLIDKAEAWFQLPEVVARHRLMQTGSNLVVGTMSKSQQIQSGVYSSQADSKVQHTPQWLDAGAVYGTYKSLRNLFEEANKQKREDLDSTEVLSSVITGNMKGLAFNVDVSSELYQSMSEGAIAYGTDLQGGFSLFSFEEDRFDNFEANSISDLAELDLLKSEHLSFWYKRPIARTHISNRIPVLLHSEKGKEVHETWWEIMWFTQKGTKEELWETLNKDTNPGQAGAWNGNEWLSFRAICGKAAVF